MRLFPMALICIARGVLERHPVAKLAPELMMNGKLGQMSSRRTGLIIMSVPAAQDFCRES